VICVDDRPILPSLWTDETIPRKAQIYTVRELVDLRDVGADEESLLLVEIVNKPRMYFTDAGPIWEEMSFRVSRFRPASRSTTFSARSPH
jgi:hypothetical protein